MKNHFVIRFVPFGGHFDDFMRPLIQELHDLEKGVMMKMNDKDVWVITSIRLVTTDMPQGNDLSDVKKQGTSYECRNCLVPKDQLTDNVFDGRHFAHFHHITKECFIELQGLINKNVTQIEIKDFTRCNSLRLKLGVLSSLS